MMPMASDICEPPQKPSMTVLVAIALIGLVVNASVHALTVFWGLKPSRVLLGILNVLAVFVMFAAYRTSSHTVRKVPKHLVGLAVSSIWLSGHILAVGLLAMYGLTRFVILLIEVSMVLSARIDMEVMLKDFYPATTAFLMAGYALPLWSMWLDRGLQRWLSENNPAD
jgi:hypothetical protein